MEKAKGNTSSHTMTRRRRYNAALADAFRRQAYLEFSTPQAATALKRHIESSAFSEPNESQPVPRKYSVAFSSPHSNPYRTGPKDTAARQQFSQQPNNLGNQPARGPSNFRGRGAMNPRGNFGRGGFSNTPPQMKAQPQMGNFGGGGMGNFGAGGMGNMGANFGNFGRGGNMSMMNGFGGMRGGMAGPNAGGMGRGGMGMMGMNPMGMGGMPMQGMNMGMMPQGMGNMGGMGMGMGELSYAIPAFYVIRNNTLPLLATASTTLLTFLQVRISLAGCRS